MAYQPPRLEIVADETAVSHAAAAHLVRLAQEAMAERGRFIVSLAGGGTPMGLYRLLTQAPYRTAVAWQNVIFFWGDERLVPPEDAGSNFGQVAAILQELAIPAEHICRVKGEWQAPQAVADYEACLQTWAEPGHAWTRFDLVLLGMGADGHTASLFPGSPLSDEATAVLAVTAEYEDRPAQRLTLTPAVFNAARTVLCLVTGEKKAAAVTAVLQGAFDPQKWPIQRIQPTAGQAIWLLDQAAARYVSRDRH